MDALRYVEMASDAFIEGWLVPFGGSFDGKDSYGTFATRNTDFCLDWFAPNARPLLYHHGRDPDVGPVPIGRMCGLEVRDKGVWMQAQLDKRNAYFEEIKQLVCDGQLGLSSGAMAHLVDIDERTGEWKRWPIVEGTTTPQESNLLATIDLHTWRSHVRAAGIELPADALARLEEPPLRQAVRAGLEYLFSGQFANVVEPVMVRAEHDDILDRVAATIFPSHNVADVIRSVLPSTDGTAIAKPLAGGDAKNVVVGVDSHVAATGHEPAVQGVAARVRTGEMLPFALAAQIHKFLPADLTDTADFPARVRGMDLLKRQLADIAAEGGVAQLVGPAAHNGLAAVQTGLGVHTQTALSDVASKRHDDNRAVDDNVSVSYRAVWSTAYQNDLPDSAFLIVESGGAKDEEGKTTPRSLRHFPVKNTSGSLDEAHVRNALARIPQSNLSAALKSKALAKARRYAKQLGIDVSQDSGRSAIRQADDGADEDEPTGYDGSYEDLISDLRDLLNPSNPFSQAGYSSIIATYPDHVLCCRWDGAGDALSDEEQTYWSVAYSVGVDGEPVLGTATQVEQTYVPVASSRSRLGPLALDAHHLTLHAGALAQRTQDLSDRRIREGRVFSAHNRQLLADAHARMGEAHQSLGDLLAATDRQADEAARAAQWGDPAYRRQQFALLDLFASTVE